MITFKEFLYICEVAIATNKAFTKPPGPGKATAVKPPTRSLTSKALNSPVGKFAVNTVLRRLPHVKAASVINAGPVADGTLDAARKRGDLK